jgi:hypothetical protein
MSYTVKPETYTRCHIQSGLTALAQARPDWREALDAVATLFNVEVDAGGGADGHSGWLIDVTPRCQAREAAQGLRREVANGRG